MPPQETPTPAFPPPGRLRRLDGRVKLALLLAFCFVTQGLPDAWLAPWLAALCLLFLNREMRAAPMRAMLRGGLFFSLFWFIMKAASDAMGTASLADAAWAALPLAARLFAFALVGMGFVGLSSPVEIGRSAAWYLGFAAGRRAWKPALAIALTAWFLPQTLRLASDVRTAIRARGLRLSWRDKALIIVGVSLRILERKADELAVGLASRRVDDYRSWYASE